MTRLLDGAAHGHREDEIESGAGPCANRRVDCHARRSHRFRLRRRAWRGVCIPCRLRDLVSWSLGSGGDGDRRCGANRLDRRFERGRVGGSGARRPVGSFTVTGSTAGSAGKAAGSAGGSFASSSTTPATGSIDAASASVSTGGSGSIAGSAAASPVAGVSIRAGSRQLSARPEPTHLSCRWGTYFAPLCDDVFLDREGLTAHPAGQISSRDRVEAIDRWAIDRHDGALGQERDQGRFVRGGLLQRGLHAQHAGRGKHRRWTRKCRPEQRDERHHGAQTDRDRPRHRRRPSLQPVMGSRQPRHPGATAFDSRPPPQEGQSHPPNAR